MKSAHNGTVGYFSRYNSFYKTSCSGRNANCNVKILIGSSSVDLQRLIKRAQGDAFEAL